MTHPIHRVEAFELVGPYAIRLTFEDRSEQVIDFRPVLAGELYGPLTDPLLFNQVQLDPEAGTLVWPNGADFDPATLHEWPNVCDELARRAASWSRVSA
ncbi:MAG: DUF2442 domain-containing protein [Acidobacteria bacterium]|nr:DUF2442 domain-containing protein [Acidobacteriota bacterium]